MKTRTLILSGVHNNTIITATLTIRGEDSMFCKLQIYGELEQEPICLVLATENKNYVAQNIECVNNFNFVLEEVGIDSNLCIALFNEKTGDCVMSNSLTQEQKMELWQHFVHNTKEKTKVELQSQSTNDAQYMPQTDAKVDFYASIEEQFNTLFENNKHCEEVEQLIENSQWVSVELEDDGAQPYILGKIFDENEKLKYICFGQASKNDKEVPCNIDLDYAQWLPVNEDRGYFIMYQDANTGENVKFD